MPKSKLDQLIEEKIYNLLVSEYLAEVIKKAMRELVHEVWREHMHKLHTIRASIPLTYGKEARKMIKELIDETGGGNE